MSLDLSAAALIRAGSSLLFLLLGTFVLLVGVRGQPPGAERRWRASLAVYALSQGILGVAFALAAADPFLGPGVLSIGTLLALVSAVALLGLIRHFTGTRIAVALAALAFLAQFAANTQVLLRDTAEYFARVNGYAPTAIPLTMPYLAVSGAPISLLWSLHVVLPFAYRAASGQVERRRILALGIGLYLGFAVNGGRRIALAAGDPALGMSMALADATAILLVALCWLRAATGEGARAARNMAIFAVGIQLLSMVVVALVGRELVGTATLFALARVLAVSFLAYAFVRWDILGVPIARRTLDRGTAVTVALASLFIVAQLAQEFFSAAYGLLVGGVVAGALVFVMVPLQRAAERLAVRVAPADGRGGDPAAAGSAKESNYRDAVRLALRDRRVTRHEEIVLARLAEHLGIGAGRAMELRHEVEDETLRGAG